MLQELKQPQCLSDSLMDQSYSLLEISEIASPLSLDQTLTLRVRCRGKIYRFTVNKVCVYTAVNNSLMLSSARHA